VVHSIPTDALLIEPLLPLFIQLLDAAEARTD
jgi:hypothetical protein